LLSPTWAGLRPTADRLRETLFNVLTPRVAGARVMDGYAGTGAVGIEALSRGAAHVTFVDSDSRAQALIAENLGRCEVQSGYAIIRATVARSAEVLRNDPAFVPFDLIFLDPPYDLRSSGEAHRKVSSERFRESSSERFKRPSRTPSRELSGAPPDVPSDPVADLLVTVEGLLGPDGLLVLEHARRQPAPETAGRLIRQRLLRSGDSSLSFYTCQP
jgi:16S rRNA (guanine966-N2)-methyltransferase